MKRIKKSIEIKASTSLVYSEWSQREELPLFVPGVRAVRRLDDRHVFFQTGIFGNEAGWEAEIYEMAPDKLVAWRSIQGSRHSGLILFESLGARLTRMTVVVEYEFEGAPAQSHDVFDAVASRVDRDLQTFSDHIKQQSLSLASMAHSCGREMEAVACEGN